MRGLALETMAYFIIAIIGVSLLLYFLMSKVSPSIREGYCRFLAGLSGLLPLPKHLKPSLPKYCKPEGVTSEECVLRTREPESIAFQLASRIIACWEVTGKVGLDEDRLCYECYLENGVEGVVTEDMVMSYVSEYSKDYGGIVLWEVGNIDRRMSVAIKYNSQQRVVEVI